MSVMTMCSMFSMPRYHVARKHMESDMRGEDLIFWTGRGEQKSGFFIAEVDGKPVGTVAYQTKVRPLHSPKRLIDKHYLKLKTELQVVELD